ncbi:hypothetical protein Mapa_010387 [Marchantia paleacea]|nr:hypothetical protein Mapa_010387 [Marchantia paleacea]
MFFNKMIIIRRHSNINLAVRAYSAKLSFDQDALFFIHFHFQIIFMTLLSKCDRDRSYTTYSGSTSVTRYQMVPYRAPTYIPA